MVVAGGYCILQPVYTIVNNENDKLVAKQINELSKNTLGAWEVGETHTQFIGAHGLDLLILSLVKH